MAYSPPGRQSTLAGRARAGGAANRPDVLQTHGIDAVEAATDRDAAEIAQRDRRWRLELRHCRARGDEAAFHIAAMGFQTRGRVHDIAVKDDGALDVADLADDDRAEMKTAADARDNAEVAVEAGSRAQQLRAHRHETSQRT